MYGRPREEEEVVLAANAETGITLWEHATPLTFQSDAAEMGNGPYATPLIAGDRVFTTGVAGRLQCLDKRTGKLLWTQQLWEDHGGSRLTYGYASSPIAFRDTVIVPVGGAGKALMAFRQADGRTAWSKNDPGNAYSSPLLIDVDGLEQLAILMDGAIFAVNPHNGDLQWQVPFKADYSIAVATPVWGPDNLLFVSSESGWQPHDRLPIPAGLQDHGEGAAALAPLVDAARAGRHARLPTGSPKHDGGRSRLKNPPRPQRTVTFDRGAVGSPVKVLRLPPIQDSAAWRPGINSLPVSSEPCKAVTRIGS